MRAVLVGNQNCGKSTLFNILTGDNQKIGNWPGVTVSKKSGIINELDLELVDLPGIYSLSPYSLEEKITCGFLKNEEYDLIINVLDASSLERGLYLTTQLLSLPKKTIIVLNMMDKLQKSGTVIDVEKMKTYLNTDICTISAVQGSGFVNLLKTIKTNTYINKNRIRFNFDDEKEISERYKFIDEICRICIKRKRNNSNDFLDKIVLNKYLAIPIFVIIMLCMYYISIEIFGKFFSSYTIAFISNLKFFTHELLESFNISSWIESLVCDGIITGVGSVLSFLPQLCMIFFTTSFLEICGYMSRVSFIFDKLIGKFGLSGKSLIPFILGTGCSVSGILSSKIIEQDKPRISTIITTSFIPCSAKLPVITLFSSYFFRENFALVATSFYFLSIVIVIASATLFKKLFNEKEADLYIFELPEYKLPKIKFLFKDVKTKVIDFVKKAGTVIFLASILIWVLLSFSMNFEYGVTIEDSILALIGKRISWIFKPVFGVDSWQASISAIQGLIAKEQIISSMEIISGLSGEFKNSLDIFSQGSPFDFFTYSSAYSFVAFNLFTVPCIAAITAMFRELKSLKYFLFAICYQLFVGWTSGCIIYNFLSIF